jgi:hypothetical protein
MSPRVGVRAGAETNGSASLGSAAGRSREGSEAGTVREGPDSVRIKIVPIGDPT